MAEENLFLYEKVRSVPDTAKKKIQGGRTKGFTDINPIWRIKTLTEQFGPCGIGWYFEVTEKWMERLGDEIAAFVEIALYVKMNGEWSKPIYGTGGSKFATKENTGIYVSDECYKMATTDALSVACKHLGIGADVYWEADRTKYSRAENTAQKEALEEKYVNTLFAELKRTGVGMKPLLNQYNVKDIHDLTLEQWKDAMDVLKKKPDKYTATQPPEHIDDKGLPFAEV